MTSANEADPVLPSELDLNLMLSLEALLLEHSVTKAANRLGLTQSAMSHRLRRLRSLFEDPLLVGGRNGMVPTPRAENLLAPLRDGLRQLRGIWANAQPFDPATSRKECVVVAPDICEYAILPRVLARLEVEAPYVTTRMLEPWPGMFSALEEGRADLYVGGPVDAPAGFVQKTVAEDSFACLVRADHPDVGDVLDMDTYVSLSHLVIAVGDPDAPSDVDQLLAAQGLQRKVSMRIPHFLGAPHTVARSNLIVTTSAALARYAVEILPLRMLPCPMPMPSTRVYAMWHERFKRDPAHRWLRQLSADCTKDALMPATKPAGA